MAGVEGRATLFTPQGVRVGFPSFAVSYQLAYKGGVGWDFATGLGSVNATNLVLDPIWLSGALTE